MLDQRRCPGYVAGLGDRPGGVATDRGDHRQLRRVLRVSTEQGGGVCATVRPQKVGGLAPYASHGRLCVRGQRYRVGMDRRRGFHGIGDVAAMAVAGHAVRDPLQGGHQCGRRIHRRRRLIALRVIVIRQEDQEARDGAVR